jgi:hypothetical protein
MGLSGMSLAFGLLSLGLFDWIGLLFVGLVFGMFLSPGLLSGVLLLNKLFSGLLAMALPSGGLLFAVRDGVGLGVIPIPLSNLSWPLLH